MDKNSSSESTQTEHTTRSKLDDWTIKNTFAENCRDEYFTPGSLFHICKFGFISFDDLPEEGKEMVRAYRIEYLKGCTTDNDQPETYQPSPTISP